MALDQLLIVTLGPPLSSSKYPPSSVTVVAPLMAFARRSAITRRSVASDATSSSAARVIVWAKALDPLQS